MPNRSAPRRATVRCLVLAASAVLPAAGWAQSPAPGGTPPPPGMSLAQSAARRFPQPVRVGSLIGRPVLQPVESQAVLGTLRAVVRDRGGAESAVIGLGGWWGFGQRLVAVPLDAMVLLGDVTEVAAFTPAQLRALPSFDSDGTVALGPEMVVRVGLAKPSH